jgi:hypothetical protein
VFGEICLARGTRVRSVKEFGQCQRKSTFRFSLVIPSHVLTEQIVAAHRGPEQRPVIACADVIVKRMAFHVADIVLERWWRDTLV